jgi:(p)ppGpp synthase/HD superfamily hydrolase
MVSLFNKAIIIAEKVHANQMDKKGYPYMSHVIDIASRVSHFGESYQIVGLLHDAIEDAEPTSFRSEIAKEIESTFDIEIINAIKAMTKVLGEDYYKSYLPRLKKDKIAIQIKIADASHNLSKAHLIEDRVFQNKLREKYIKVLDVLGEDVLRCEKPIIFRNGLWVEE